MSVVASDFDISIGRTSGTSPAREAMKRQEAEVVAEAQRREQTLGDFSRKQDRSLGDTQGETCLEPDHKG